MEAEIDNMNRKLASLKQSKVKEKKKEKKVVEKRPPPPPVASSSKPTPKSNGKAAAAAAAPPVNRKKPSKKPIEDNDVLSFEQKKELSDTIGKLDGSKLERVIQIIHEGVPEIRDVRWFHVCHSARLTSPSCRARRRSSSRSTPFPLPSSRSSTTSSFVPTDRLRRSAPGRARAPARVA